MHRQSGFSWIELIMVVAVIALLAGLALPGMQETALRKQVKEALALADVAKAGVQKAWSATGVMPKDNEAAEVPPSDKIIGNLVRAVEVEKGAVSVIFGNNASNALHGKRVTLRPAFVPDQPVVPLAWICHGVDVPRGMELAGEDRTDVQSSWLPVECRSSKTASK